MSKGVGVTTQIKRPNPKFTLGFNRDAAKLVDEKGHTHRAGGGQLRDAIKQWADGRVQDEAPQPHPPPRRQP